MGTHLADVDYSLAPFFSELELQIVLQTYLFFFRMFMNVVLSGVCLLDVDISLETGWVKLSQV